MAEPFLRWAGGKRWLARKLAPLLRERLEGRYMEPFLGSGAVFFAVNPPKAILGDLNSDLVNAFRLVAERPQQLLNAIRLIPVDADTYYSLRRHEPSDVFQRAVRFIYLNRTCYGGLYRENKAGHFNVPYGGGSRTPALLWDRDVLEIAHRVLASCDIDLRVCDFEATLEKAGAGDVVYCDPTYRGAGRDRFDRYGKVVFGWQDHVRVAAAACRARRRGALVFVSNSSCAEIRDLYPDGLEIRMFKSKSIGNRSKNPERQREVLIILDPERSERWRHLDWSHEVLSLRSSRVEKDTGHGVPKEDQSELAEKAARAA